jgi:hypothetical protein
MRRTHHNLFFQPLGGVDPILRDAKNTFAQFGFHVSAGQQNVRATTNVLSESSAGVDKAGQGQHQGAYDDT